MGQSAYYAKNLANVTQSLQGTVRIDSTKGIHVAYVYFL